MTARAGVLLAWVLLLGCPGGEGNDTGREVVDPPRIDAFDATPATVSWNGEVTLSWEVAGADQLVVVVVEDGGTRCDTDAACAFEGDLAVGSMVLPPPYLTTTFRLYAFNEGGQAQSDAAVAISPPVFGDGGMTTNDLALWRLHHSPVSPPYRFVVINDTRPSSADCGTEVEQAAFVDLRGQIALLDPPPAFVVDIGDLVNTGAECQWSLYVDTVSDFMETTGIPWVSIAGNHEFNAVEGHEQYALWFGDEDFSFDVGKTRFVALNATHGGDVGTALTEEQLDWLEQEIANAGTGEMADVFVMMHIPPRLPSRTPMDCGVLYNHYDHHFYDGQLGFSGADDFLSILEDNAPPVTAGLYGHVHALGIFTRNGVRQLISGGGGAELCSAGTYHEGDFGHDTPFHDGIGYHYALMTVQSDLGQDYTGGIVWRGEENTPDPAYSFDHFTDDPHLRLPLPFVARFDGIDEPLDALGFWTPYHEALNPSGLAQWHLDPEAGTLRQDGNFYLGSASDCTPQCLGTITHTWTTDWSDYRVEAEVVSDDNDAYGLLFYYQDDDHYYRFSVDRQRSYVLLARKDPGTAVANLAKVHGISPPGAGIPVQLAVEVQTGAASTTITATMDNVTVLTWEDVSAEHLLQGGVGLYTWGNEGTAFDDVTVDVLAR